MNRLVPAVAVFVFAAAAVVCWTVPRSPARQVRGALAERAAPVGLCGRIETVSGQRAIELWGSTEQRAFAEGYLLAGDIVELIDDYVLSPSILPNPQVYEVALVPAVRRQFIWPAETIAELDAMLLGARERLGAGALRSRKLNREIMLEDLMVANCLADWFGMFCSTVSVWGARTADGQTLAGRNLDYPSTESMARAQIVKIHRPREGAPGWIEVSWPGMIGVYTAMNDAGVSVFLHDAPGLPPSHSGGFTPRSLILREALLAARAESWPGEVTRVLRSHRVLVGNNLHVSAPRVDGVAPAGVFEYDGNERDGGVTLRLADPHESADAIWCTNHQRARRDPSTCKRYTALSQTLGDSGEGGPLTIDSLERILTGVRQETTLHNVTVAPARLLFRVRIGASADAIDWNLGERLKRSTTPAASEPPSAVGVGAGRTP